MCTHLQQTTLMVNEFARSTARLRQLADHQKAILSNVVPALLRLERDVHSDGDQRRFDDLRNRFMSDWRAWIARLMSESDQANIDPASSTALIAFLLDHIHPKRLRELCERTDPICQWSQSQAIMAHLKLSAHFHASEAMPPEQRVYMDLDWALMTDYRALASALSTLETIDRHHDPMRQGESDC